MLNILNKNSHSVKSLKISSNKDNYNNISLNNKGINKDGIIQNKSTKDEYKNIYYYPSSSKEWFTSIYSFNKSYTKSLVTYDVILNKLFWSYCSMLQNKIKKLFKRRRHNKSRYSANKIYVSRAELKHTNTKLLIILYTYNKQKSSIEYYIRKIINLTRIYRVLVEDQLQYIVSEKNRTISISKNNKSMVISKKILDDTGQLKFIITHRNRLIHFMKNNFITFKKWKMVFFKESNNILKYLTLNIKRRNYYKIPKYNSIVKKLFRLQKLLFNSTKSINFNKSKFNNLILTLRNTGLINLLQKVYGKKVEIKLVELKSVHLHTDTFSSAVALKLRDRQNKAVRVLRKAILQMVKIPDLYTLITFDDNIETINKDNIVSTIKQQVVSGVRFEASGRLTRRLTAMRAIFKYRYTGSLKDIRSSFNKKSSTMLRGYVKSNSQYAIINTKTRNGSFGLKGWVSSH